MRVGNIMTTDVRTCLESDSLTACALMMKELNVGAIPVVDEVNNLVGIITDRDICVRAAAKGVDLNQAQVGSFMTANPITVGPETDVEDAADLMADNQVRRLPVVHDGKVAGIISLGDLAVDVGEPEMVAEVLEQVSVPVR